MYKYRRTVIGVFTVLAIISLYLAATRIRFNYDLESFFPIGDPDMEFFKDFRAQFENDDNFLLVGLTRQEGVFEQNFLTKVQDFSIKAADLPTVVSVQSLTKFQYPIRVPFLNTFTLVDAIHVDDTSRYENDRNKILSDERMVNNLIDKEAKTLVVALKTQPNITQNDAENLIDSLNQLVNSYQFSEYHYLGKAYFQKVVVGLAIWEFILAILGSASLVMLVMWLMFRRFWGVAISVASIMLGMIIFVGELALIGQPLDALAALYPIVMIIVCVSDVVHVMSKYIDELNTGKSREEAIKITFKQIGVAVFVTSITTAISFASLVTASIPPVIHFGINAAMGVMTAYVVVLLFTTAALSSFEAEQIIKPGRQAKFWSDMMEWYYQYTKRNGRKILIVFGALIVFCIIGTYQVSTNYRIDESLPKHQKLSDDFRFYEKHFAGFRPFDIAILCQNGHTTDEFGVMLQMDSLERYMKRFPAVQNVLSATTFYKSLNRASYGDKAATYVMPRDTAKYLQYKRIVDKFSAVSSDVLISKDHSKARISARVLDIGADSIKAIGTAIRTWAKANLDSTQIKIRETGTGVILDKNAEYVVSNVLWGLVISLSLIGVIMALMLRSWVMVIISIIPNVIPLLIAGALLGYAHIKLEAGVAMVFDIVYGIAVDDTVHFLSKFRLVRSWGYSVEEAIHYTLHETGKAVSYTTIILFFGFAMLLFSSNPPSVTVGIITSVTLFAGMFCDLFLIPVLLRTFIKDKK